MLEGLVSACMHHQLNLMYILSISESAKHYIKVKAPLDYLYLPRQNYKDIECITMATTFLNPIFLWFKKSFHGNLLYKQ